MVDHGDQDRCRSHRLLARDDLEHLVGAGIAGDRNDVRIVEAGRNVEAEPRPGAGEEIRGADRDGLVPQARLVQTPPPPRSASAMAKNTPADSTPNIGWPSTVRSSPMSTRS